VPPALPASAAPIGAAGQPHGPVGAVFERKAAGKENFQADETYRRLVASKSKSVKYRARPSSLKIRQALMTALGQKLPILNELTKVDGLLTGELVGLISGYHS
jgi:hypothetical protein